MYQELKDPDFRRGGRYSEGQQGRCQKTRLCSALFEATRKCTHHYFLIESNFDAGGTGASYCSAGNNLPRTDGSVAMLKNRLYPYPLSQQGFPQMRSWEIPIPSRPPNLFRDKMEGPWLTRRLWGCGFEELLRNTLSYIFILKKTRGGGRTKQD